MSSGKRPFSVFHRRHRHGVPRGGWAQTGTHHRLPLHWRSVVRLLSGCSVLSKQTHTQVRFLFLLLSFILLSSHPAHFALLSLSFTPVHFLLPAFCPVVSLTLCPTMLLFPSSLNHFLSLLIRLLSSHPYWSHLIFFHTLSLSRCIACLSIFLL